MTDEHAVPRHYPALTRALHWIVAIMVLATLPVGLLSCCSPRCRATCATRLFILHKNTGVIILLLVLLRLVWRACISPAPPLPAAVPRLQARIARPRMAGFTRCCW